MTPINPTKQPPVMRPIPADPNPENNMDQTQFNHDVAAIVALLVTILGAVAAIVGLPAFVTPELITQAATAITAAASIYFYIRGRNVAAASAAPAAPAA